MRSQIPALVGNLESCTCQTMALSWNTRVSASLFHRLWDGEWEEQVFLLHKSVHVPTWTSRPCPSFHVTEKPGILIHDSHVNISKTTSYGAACGFLCLLKTCTVEDKVIVNRRSSVPPSFSWASGIGRTVYLSIKPGLLLKARSSKLWFFTLNPEHLTFIFMSPLLHFPRQWMLLVNQGCVAYTNVNKKWT